MNLITYILPNHLSMSDYKRTAREIKVNDKLLANKNINVKIGTVENREAPETIYIFISFWLEPKKEHKLKDQEFLKDILDKELGQIYINKLKPELDNNLLFPKEKENIYIKNIPDNFNYNAKRNFISLELYLHTCNLLSKDKLPLTIKKDTRLFNEAVRLVNIIGDSDVVKNNSLFDIQKKSV